ncbi:MAG: 3-phosphoshikimate 1-carboxyvinyltransferase [Campylobacteraceae bacterium]|nr:3-phosphoshikimate 1-carboxyvinyltransferase [Campylobacteraceae bacterium]
MKTLNVNPAKALKVCFDDIASDKSISHRAALFSLLSDEPSSISNYLEAEDTLCTLRIVETLGAKVERKNDTLIITPPKAIKEPFSTLYCGNSGTTIRLLAGFLASKLGFFVLHGDEYLSKRPMGRVLEPLRSIGAFVDGRENGNLAPICIRGEELKSFSYASPIASAQVKSAMILAALNAKGKSKISEPSLSRDHTERMLVGMGAKLEREELSVTVFPLEKALNPLDLNIPADPSSAFFFALAAAILPGSSIVLKNVLLNKTRIEAFEVLRLMGTKINFIEKSNKYESIGDITVEYAPLKAVNIDSRIAWLIDEIPALAIAFAFAKGTSSVRNAKELRVKESDRIVATLENLEKCGIKTKEFEDGFEVIGGTLQKANVQSFGDHRIAMSFAIAGLVSGMSVEDSLCIKASFPNFVELLNKIGECSED